jgi:CheY-like chemotaxis protein
MKEGPIQILLADGDIDDCLLFGEALSELSLNTMLSTVNNGEQLVNRLASGTNLPQVLYLDLNMPRKNGYECLVEIMTNMHTRHLPVIIFSTSLDPDIVRLLFNKGARYYIRKPEDFDKLKKVVNKSLSLVFETAPGEAGFGNFVLNP